MSTGNFWDPKTPEQIQSAVQALKNEAVGGLMPTNRIVLEDGKYTVVRHAINVSTGWRFATVSPGAI